jgi:DNA-binding MarR family transcriptional regulator
MDLSPPTDPTESVDTADTLEPVEATGGTKSELGHEFIRWTRTFHLMKDGMARLLPYGLDPAAAQLLSWLVRRGPSRQNELAEASFLDPSTVSRRISQLVALHLVERRSDPMDGRASQLAPTEEGRALFRSMCALRDDMMHTALATWPEDDVAQLVGLLRRFNDDFEAYRGHRPTADPEEMHVRP